MSSSSMEGCNKKPSKSFEEGWPIIRTFLDRIINKVEGVDNSSFTVEDLMSYYSIVYELCTASNSNNAKLLYDQTKKALEEYINSTVLPSLRGKKDEVLLRELLRRWSNHRTMTKWISRIFNYPERCDLHKFGLPSIEETSFISFYDLVLDEMNKQVVDAILFKEPGREQIDRTLVNNTLAIYSEIRYVSRKHQAKGLAERMIRDKAEFFLRMMQQKDDAASNWIASSSSKDNTPKEEKSHEKNVVHSSKKIKLESCDGVIYEVDYNVALMSRTIEDIINANPTRDDDGDDSVEIPLSYVSSKILGKVIEYCKKHTEHDAASSADDKNIAFISDIVEWDDEFVEVDYTTLFDLIMASNYLNIKGLLDLCSNKVGQMMKGKTPSEFRNMFNIKEETTQQN